jgi:hypothetical protein
MSSSQPRSVGLNDLGQLTMRANVAFAVRCAQRARPRFKLAPNAPRRHDQLLAVDRAIRIATMFCQGLVGEPGQASAAAHAASRVAEATCEFTGYAGYGAVRAAEAAAHAEECIRNPAGASPMRVVAAAFGAARVLAANADMFAIQTIADALYADMEKLINLAHGTCESLGPPVDPSESGPLGPLWAAGTPPCFAGSIESAED